MTTAGRFHGVMWARRKVRGMLLMALVTVELQAFVGMVVRGARRERPVAGEHEPGDGSARLPILCPLSCRPAACRAMTVSVDINK